jgi:methyl-accepting chemotaxis protein
MTGQISLAARLAFHGIDARTSELLRQNKNFVITELPALLDSFYAHLGQFAETNAFFRSREHVAAAKAAQIRHWGAIMDGRFDDGYQASVRRIGETHHRIGLAPHWYIGGYNALLSGLLSVIGKRGTAPPSSKGLFGRSSAPEDDLRTELQIAVSKAALLDIDLAIDVYIEAGKRDLNSLASSVVQMVGTVADTTQILQDAADQLSGTAQTSTDRTTMVAAAAEQASVNVRAVAAAAEELSSSVQEIGRQVSISTDMAGKAVQTVTATSSKVRDLSEAATQIGAVVELISNIARQTNLLALNATIEAARAGEAGKGFAVVAQEVKTLAAQTGKATAEIGAQISAIQSATSDAVTSINAITEVISDMSSITSTIASAVEEQGSATTDIARNVQEAAQGTAEVAANTTGLTDAASATRTGADQVAVSARDIADKAAELQKLASGFLARANAA